MIFLHDLFILIIYLSLQAVVLADMTGHSVEAESLFVNSSLGEVKLTIYDLFGPDLKFSTYIYSVIWFSLSFGSYGISTWINVLFENIGVGNVYLNSFIFALANLPGNMFAIYYIDILGRRKLLCYGMVLAAFSALGFAFGTSIPSVVVTCACLFNAFSVAGWNALDCMSVENFPTDIRTTAMGTLAAAGRLGAICAQFVNGTLENNVAVLLFVTSSCMMIGGIAALFTPRDAVGNSL
jgi:MFS family permease